VTPLAFFVDGIKVAEGSLPGFEFPNGNYSKSYPTNLLQTLAPNATLTEDIFSSFVMGNDVQMVMQGQGSDDFPYMSDVIKAMSADVLVKGNTVPLLLKATMSPDLVDTFKGIVPTALKIENPFSEQVLITGCDLGVYFKGTEVGYITEQFGDDPIVIPASGTMDTRDLDVDLIMSWTTFLAMIEGLVSVKLDVSGTLDFQVDEFIGKNVYYEQLQIPSSIWSSTPDNATLA
jgi:hypothetical protein